MLTSQLLPYVPRRYMPEGLRCTHMIGTAAMLRVAQGEVSCRV